MPRLIFKSGFKTIIIIIFIFIFTRVNLGWLFWSMINDQWSRSYTRLAPESSFKTMIIIIFILNWLGLTLLARDRPYPQSGFKTIIITIFILTLTRVNGQLHSWIGPYPEPTFESSFKTMIIIIFIPILIWVNPTHNLSLNQ